MLKLIVQYLLVSGMVLCYSSANAQRFSFDPDKSIDIEYYKDDFASNQIIITNLTNESLSFRWRIISNTFSSDWGFSICDLGSCFPTPPDSNDMNPTSIGGNAYFICHTQFNGVVDSGALVLFVFEIGDEVNGDTVTFKYTTTNVVDVEENSLPEYEVKLFPNPVVDVLYLNTDVSSAVSNIRIYNILGEQVYHTETNPEILSDGILLEYLSSGIYHMSVLFENGNRKTVAFYKSR